LWGAGALALAVIAALIIHSALSTGTQPGALQSESNGSTVSSPPPGGQTDSATPSPNPTLPASATATVPPALAGTWSGQARQTDPADIFSVRVTLIAGGHAGTISYSGTTFSCSGDLSMVSFSGGTLTMNQGIITGQTTCANGVVTLRQGSFGTLLFRFRGRSGPAARGTLAKR